MARPLTKDEFENIQTLVDNRADCMIDQGTYDDKDQALDMAWEMVRDDIRYTEDLAGWAKDFDQPAAILEVDQKAIAIAAQHDDYEEYLKWYAKEYGRKANARLKRSLM